MGRASARPKWMPIWTQNGLEPPGQGGMDGQGAPTGAWSAAQKHQGANASDGSDQFGVLEAKLRKRYLS